jgi:hypothetical protein
MAEDAEESALEVWNRRGGGAADRSQVRRVFSDLVIAVRGQLIAVQEFTIAKLVWWTNLVSGLLGHARL